MNGFLLFEIYYLYGLPMGDHGDIGTVVRFQTNYFLNIQKLISSDGINAPNTVCNLPEKLWQFSSPLSSTTSLEKQSTQSLCQITCNFPPNLCHNKHKQPHQQRQMVLTMAKGMVTQLKNITRTNNHWRCKLQMTIFHFEKKKWDNPKWS